MTLTAVLFVGGESRRMGADKATLSWSGEPLWARQMRTLRELEPDEVWVSARTRPRWCPPDVEVVLDEPPARGPLGGLAAALARVRTTHLLALAIDLPRMTAGHLRELWSLAGTGSGVLPVNLVGADVRRPCESGMAVGASSRRLLQGGRFMVRMRSHFRDCRLPVNGWTAEPLAAIYPAGAFALAIVREALATGNHSLQACALALSDRGRMLPFPLTTADTTFYSNTNTPGEFADALLPQPYSSRS